jgi:ATP-dependent helicase HrpA
MVAELMETSRLWGLDAARIDPKWVEPLAGHLVTRTYSEPRWEPRRGQVVATERVTLFGLPIVEGRTVAYGRIDPGVARELFIRRALVEREWESRHEFLHANERSLDAVRALEDRARRRDILVEDRVLFDFYDARIPADVVSGAHFDRWWRDARRADPDLLTFDRELLVRPEAADALDAAGRPDTWTQGELTLPLSYRFDPGAAHDGVTVHVPLKLLGALAPDGFEWLVPAFRAELITALIRSLPKELRRPLVPVPEVVGQLADALEPRGEPLLVALARELERLRGVRVPPDAWDLSRLPSHLRMTFRIEDDRRGVLAEGQDLDALREAVRPRLRAELAAATRKLERTGMRSFDLESLPRAVALPGTGRAVRAYPALVDEGETVGVRALDTPAARDAAMLAGTRRLLTLTIPSPLRHVQQRLTNADQLALASAPHGSARAVLEDAQVAALDALIARAGGPAWDAAGFGDLRDAVAGELAETTAAVVAQVARILDAAREVQRALEPLTAVELQPARADIDRQLRRLVRPGFVAITGVARLPDVERYLRAAARRAERLPSAPAPDRDRMRSVHELEAAYRARLEGWPRGRPVPDALRDVPWMLEELRVSHFAQALGTRGAISAKRVRAAIDGGR